MCIYIYIYIHNSLSDRIDPTRRGPGLFGIQLDHEGTDSVRFVSVQDFSTINRFGSVRFGNLPFPVDTT